MEVEVSGAKEAVIHVHHLNRGSGNMGGDACKYTLYMIYEDKRGEKLKRFDVISMTRL